MAARPTKSQLNQMVEELLAIQSIAERYKHLEGQVKAAMLELDMSEVATSGGRVFISVAERTVITPEIARAILGELAVKVIQITETVPSKRLEALVEIGEITADKMGELEGQARKTSVVSLHVRPLK